MALRIAFVMLIVASSARSQERRRYAAEERWKQIEVPEGDRYTWPDSTYVRKPSFFERCTYGSFTWRRSHCLLECDLLICLLNQSGKMRNGGTKERRQCKIV